MEEIISNIVSTITSFMSNFGIISGFLLIVLESMIPILPLGLFIALNIITFGDELGFIVSWLATILGSIFIFIICRKLQKIFFKRYYKSKKIMSIKKSINNISYTNLVLIMSIPFTPAFAVNIAAGLSDISFKKFFASLIIGKIPLIYFWGFIGKSLLESFTDISVIAQIIFMLIMAYFVSKLVNKFLKL